MKIGIVTHYFKSLNYGGNLQAYALCKIINNLGYKAEQLCVPFDYYKKTNHLKDLIIKSKIKIFQFIDKTKHHNYNKNFKARMNVMIEFNQNNIPHSNNVYNLKNINMALNDYDIFITGSDIVWGPKVHSPFFFLTFVPTETPKFSYAASLGTNSLTVEEKKQFKIDLESFQDVSVREESVIPFLSECLNRDVKLCLDPTLLLDKSEWDEICSDRVINKSYLFCYFLGNNINAVNCAKAFAKKNGLLLVNIPYLSSTYKGYNDFGDVKLSNVSPKEFLSLIKYSSCVFTDSFHACVFSYIYEKNIFAFKRSQNDDIGVRVKDFLSLINANDHFCNTEAKENLSYITLQKDIDYSKSVEKINTLKKKSIEYLLKNLKQAEEKIKEQ